MAGNWIAGVRVPGPRPGRPIRTPLRKRFEARMREECAEPAIRALRAACEAGEPWAVILALAYGYGKPNEKPLEEDDAQRDMATRLGDGQVLKLLDKGEEETDAETEGETN